MSKSNINWLNHLQKQIDYGKYVFYMLTSIITTTTTNATDKGPHN